MLLIGSRAAAAWGLNAPGRDIKANTDTDFIMTWTEFSAWTPERQTARYPISERNWLVRVADYPGPIEVEIAWEGTAAHALLLEEQGVCAGVRGEVQVASREALLALKLSHRYLKDSPFFLKTMADIKYMRACGVELNERWLAWVKRREDETYTYKHPALNRKKNQFFTSNVKYVYDHDSLHEAVAVEERPAYTQYQKAGAEVECDMDAFDALPWRTRLFGVYEEACVLALERAVVPHGAEPDWAFLKALEKVCTSITSGRFREFAWENYYDVVALYEATKDSAYPIHHYVTKFHTGLASGVVKPYIGSTY